MMKTWGYWFLFLAIWTLPGCRWLFKKPDPPQDPLFLIKKPIESKAKFGPPLVVPNHEPTPPADPYYMKHRRGF